MTVKISGEVVSVGANESGGKTFPYFEILQRGESKSELVSVEGSGVKLGDKINDMPVIIRLFETKTGRSFLKVRRAA